MKSIDPQAIDRLPGIALTPSSVFHFRCHRNLACFNQCCRHLNLFLYPYDVVRLRKCLDVDSDHFLDTYTDVVLREGNAFPEVLRRMADNASQTSPIVRTPAGHFRWNMGCCTGNTPIDLNGSVSSVCPISARAAMKINHGPFPAGSTIRRRPSTIG